MESSRLICVLVKQLQPSLVIHEAEQGLYLIGAATDRGCCKPVFFSPCCLVRWICRLGLTRKAAHRPQYPLVCLVG